MTTLVFRTLATRTALPVCCEPQPFASPPRPDLGCLAALPVPSPLPGPPGATCYRSDRNQTAFYFKNSSRGRHIGQTRRDAMFPIGSTTPQHVVRTCLRTQRHAPY
jgi:hypothetical protein